MDIFRRQLGANAIATVGMTGIGDVSGLFAGYGHQHRRHCVAARRGGEKITNSHAQGKAVALSVLVAAVFGDCYQG